jgi:hypothetical protein
MIFKQTFVVKQNVGKNQHACIRSPHGEATGGEYHTIHDNHSISNQKFQLLSTTRDPTLNLCPCCVNNDEDHHHFDLCMANPSRAAAIETLIKEISLDDSHPYGTAMLTSLTQVLNDPTISISFRYEKFVEGVRPPP